MSAIYLKKARLPVKPQTVQHTGLKVWSCLTYLGNLGMNDKISLCMKKIKYFILHVSFRFN